MKSNFLFLLFLVLSVAFYGCGKNDDDAVKPVPVDPEPNNPTTSTTAFKAKIDTTDWQASQHSTMTSGGLFALYGVNNNKVTIEIHTSEITSTGPKTWGSLLVETVNPDNSYNRWIAYLSDSVNNQLVITKYDSAAKKISGTFRFKTTAYFGIPADSASKTITDGVFTDIKIP